MRSEFVPVAHAVLTELASVVGPKNCISDPAGLRTYECDGLTSFRMVPGAVILPATTEEVVEAVRIARRANLPIVPRGSGTGLSGGALPVPGCVVIGLSRMKRILEIDLENGRMRVEPGVFNLDVSKAVGAAGYYYAPDPSSQSVCSIGGNVAENSGGAHCLKYGFTVNHVLGARVVLSDGSVVDLGGPVLDTLGYDLIGVFVGSEGTLGIVTEVVVRILRKPEATRTFFATFPSTDEAGAAVSAIIAAGIVPAAVEMMDRLAIVAIKAATGVDWPDVGAALLMDVDGPLGEVEHTAAQATAFAAVGRISPNYIVQDGVIPRSEIATVLRKISRLTAELGLRVANVFHAGDGNLHPLILYDASVPGVEEKAEHLGGEILKICVRTGGSLTGEHGIGADKAPYMLEMFSEADLEAMWQLRCAFDSENRFNPGKVFPTPRLCGDRPGKYVPTRSELSGEAGRG